MPKLVLEENDDLDMGMALQAGHERLQVAGAIPEIGLEVELGNDDIREPLLEVGLGLALGIDDICLETQIFVEGIQIWIAPELNDRQEARFFTCHLVAIRQMGSVGSDTLARLKLRASISTARRLARYFPDKKQRRPTVLALLYGEPGTCALE